MGSQIPQTDVESTKGKPISQGIYRATAILGALASCSGFYFSMIEMASRIDGWGVGVLSKRPSSAFPILWFLGAGVFLAGAIGMRSWRWTGMVFAGGCVYCVVLFCSLAGQRICSITWASQCEAGDVRSCHAAADVHKYGLGDDRGTRFYARGCQLGARDDAEDELGEDRDWSVLSCHGLFQDGQRDAACAGLSAICKTDIRVACQRYRGVCSPEKAADAVEQCEDLRRRCAEGHDACSAGAWLGCKAWNKNVNTETTHSR
jgi:hypothetical protein